MAKIKPMLPTLKERKRYVAYEIMSKEKLKKDVSSNIINNLRNTLGLFDSAEAGLLSVEYDSENQKGIFRVAHDKVDKARVALTLIRNIGDSQIIPRVLGLSGTLKNARSKYMN